jgi:WD40 repeat protein
MAHPWHSTWVSFLDARYIITAGLSPRDGLRIYDTATGKRMIETAAGMFPAGVTCAAIDPKGRYVLVGGGFKKDPEDPNSLASSQLLLISMKADEEPTPLDGHKLRVKTVSVSPDGERMLSGSDDGTALLWTFGNTDNPISLEHKGAVRYSRFSFDGKQVVTGGDEPHVRFWNPQDGKLLHTLDTAAGAVKALVLHPSKPLVAIACGDNKLRFYDTKTWQRTAELAGPEGVMYALAFSPNGKLLAVGDESYLITLYDVEKQTKLHTFAGHWGDIRCVAFSPDGKMLASTGDDWTVKLWDVEKFAQ